MTEILIVDTLILAVGPFIETDSTISGPGAVFHKVTILGWQIIEAALPGDFCLAKYRYEGGAVTAIPPTSDDVATLHTDCCASVDTLRDEKIAAGCPYTFPDLSVGTIQLRDESDIRNVIVLHTGALTRITLGDTTTLRPFRDAENVDHLNLTPSEMLAMTLAARAHGEAIAATSHAHKNALKAIRDGAGTDAEKAAALAVYDITLNW